jgi:mannose-6-phosphate isomerase-like protein (cupin superfamily)
MISSLSKSSDDKNETFYRYRGSAIKRSYQWLYCTQHSYRHYDVLYIGQLKQVQQIPEHSHLHKQVAHVLKGIFELTVDGETQLLKPGIVAVIPPHVKHGGRAITSCELLDVFYPEKRRLQILNTVINLTDKTALVCGGSQGLGLATAKELVLLGAAIILASRNADKLKTAVQELDNSTGHSYINIW